MQQRKAKLSVPADVALTQEQIDDKMRILLEDKIRTTVNPVALRNATRALKKLEIESQRRQEKEAVAALEQSKQDALARTQKAFPPLNSNPQPDAKSIEHWETIAARYSEALHSLPPSAEYELSRKYLRERFEILTYALKHARHAKETADQQRRLNERAAINREAELRMSEHETAHKDIPAALPEPAPVVSERYFHPIDPPLPLPTGQAGDMSHITLPAPNMPISAGQKRVARYEDLFRDEFLRKET